MRHFLFDPFVNRALIDHGEGDPLLGHAALAVLESVGQNFCNTGITGVCSIKVARIGYSVFSADLIEPLVDRVATHMARLSMSPGQRATSIATPARVPQTVLFLDVIDGLADTHF